MSATGARAGTRNLVVQQAASFVLQLTVKTGDPATPVDLTGASAKMEVRSDTAIGVVLELSTANGRITIDGPNGVLTLRIAAADTAALSLVDFPARYDLLLTYADTTVDRILEGLVRLNPAVTEL